MHIASLFSDITGCHWTHLQGDCIQRSWTHTKPLIKNLKAKNKEMRKYALQMFSGCSTKIHHHLKNLNVGFLIAPSPPPPICFTNGISRKKCPIDLEQKRHQKIAIAFISFDFPSDSNLQTEVIKQAASQSRRPVKWSSFFRIIFLS